MTHEQILMRKIKQVVVFPFFLSDVGECKTGFV